MAFGDGYKPETLNGWRVSKSEGTWQVVDPATGKIHYRDSKETFATSWARNNKKP